MIRLLGAIAATAVLLAAGHGASARVEPQLAQTGERSGKAFSERDIRIIRDVLGGAGGAATPDGSPDGGRKAKAGRGAPSGLANRDRLPSGLERQLERNGRLPPGLDKRPFPAELARRLPPPPAGTERLIVGADAVLIETGTNIILDIIRDVVTSAR